MRNTEGRRTTLLFLLALTFLLSAGPSAAQDAAKALVGKWRVDDEASAYMGSTTERVSNDTILRTDVVSAAGGSHGSGTLEIRADGTYRLYYWWYDKLYKQGTTTGKWRVVPEGKPFGDVKAIELLDAMNKPDRPEQDRKWFVWAGEKGEIIGRVPPHDFTGKIKLKRIGGGAPGTPAKQPEVKSATPAPAASKGDPHSPPEASGGEKPKTWTPDEVRRELGGKTKQQIIALLGEPFKVSYGTYYFNNVDKKYPPCPGGCNWKSFAIQFGGEGETASSIELQYWVVE